MFTPKLTALLMRRLPNYFMGQYRTLATEWGGPMARAGTRIAAAAAGDEPDPAQAVELVEPKPTTVLGIDVRVGVIAGSAWSAGAPILGRGGGLGV
jgi:hypothetical protein